MSDIPRANPLPELGNIQPIGLGAGLSAGLKQGSDMALQGSQMGYLASQTKAQDMANQQTAYSMTPEMRALAIQKQQAETAKNQAEAQKVDIEKNLRMIETGSKMVLEGGPGTVQTGQDLIQKSYPFLTGQQLPPNTPIDKDMAKDFSWYADQYRMHQQDPSTGLNPKDAVFGVIKAASMYGKTYQDRQLALLKDSPMYGEATASLEPGTSGSSPATFNPKSGAVLGPSGSPTGQPFVPAATAASTLAENIRGAASATAPLVGSAYSVNLAKTALAKGDELNDHIAINEFGKLINNGTPIPLPELQKMAKSGTWGPKFAQAFSNFTGEGALSEEQRGMMNNALDTLGQSLQAQTTTRTAQYPGANPPNLPSASMYKVGQVIQFKQGSFKKIKDGPDTDPTTWGKAK